MDNKEQYGREAAAFFGQKWTIWNYGRKAAAFCIINKNRSLLASGNNNRRDAFLLDKKQRLFIEQLGTTVAKRPPSYLKWQLASINGLDKKQRLFIEQLGTTVEKRPPS